MNQLHYPTPPTRRVIRVLHRRALIPLMLSLVVALAALPAATGHASDIGAPGLATRLDTYLTGLAAARKFSGAALVARRGTVLLSKGYGLADRARQRPSTPRRPSGPASAASNGSAPSGWRSTAGSPTGRRSAATCRAAPPPGGPSATDDWVAYLHLE